MTGPVAYMYMIGWWAPFAAACYCGYRISEISRGIKKAGGYIAELQDQFAEQKQLKGWEARLRNQRKLGETTELDQVSIPMNLFWKLISTATLVIGIASAVILLNGQL